MERSGAFFVIFAVTACFFSMSAQAAEVMLPRSPELGRVVLAETVRHYDDVDLKYLPGAVLQAATPEKALAGLMVAEALTRPGGAERLQEYLRPAAVPHRPDLGPDAAAAVEGLARQGADSLRKAMPDLREKAAGPALKERIDAFFDGADVNLLPVAATPTAAETGPTARFSRAALYQAHQQDFSNFRGVFARYSAWNSAKPPRPWTLRYWTRFRKEENISRAVWKKLRSLGRRYVVLAADPGLALRAGRFVEFARGFDYEKHSPWELREMFKKHLGRRTVYRAMTLEAGADRPLSQAGMEASGAAVSGSAPSAFNLFREMADHMMVLGQRKDRLVSVTENPALALDVAYRYASPAYSSNDVLLGRKDLYLFKLNVWELDLLDPRADYGYRLSDPYLHETVRYRDLDGKDAQMPLDASAEAVVYGGIEPDEIESVVRVTAEDLVRPGMVRQRLGELEAAGKAP